MTRHQKVRRRDSALFWVLAESKRAELNKPNRLQLAQALLLVLWEDLNAFDDHTGIYTR